MVVLLFYMCRIVVAQFIVRARSLSEGAKPEIETKSLFLHLLES